MPDQVKSKVLDQMELDLEKLNGDAVAAGVWVLVPPIEKALEIIREERLALLEERERQKAGLTE